MASVTFKRGTRAEIEATAKQDGQILMETDQTNNKMYVDLQNNNRVRIGNSNVDDISGITDSLTATSSNIALSAAGGNNLQGQIDTLNGKLDSCIQMGSGYMFGVLATGETLKINLNSYPAFLFLNYSSSDKGYGIFRCISNTVILISGESTEKVKVNVNNYELTIENNIGWTIPYYVLKI